MLGTQARATGRGGTCSLSSTTRNTARLNAIAVTPHGSRPDMSRTKPAYDMMYQSIRRAVYPPNIRLSAWLHRLKWIAVGFAFAWAWMSKMG